MDNQSAGLRERNRRERLARIKSIARQLFRTKGYDGTTLRELGERAGLGTGTLFGYVADKRDLVWMIFEDDHAAVTQRALAAINPEADFLEQTIEGFRFYYKYFARHPRFSECILREWDFLLSRSKKRPSATMQRQIDRILRTIAIARARGEITTQASDDDLALLIFHVYQMESRRWMAAGRPRVEPGLKVLRSMMSIIINGFGRDPRAASRARRSPRKAA
jgi:AcrR family transcriptional regulator